MQRYLERALKFSFVNVCQLLQCYPMISEFYHPNGINCITFNGKPAFINNMRLSRFIFTKREKLQHYLWHDARKANKEDVKLNERAVGLQASN